jgi:hypothetical protein
MYNTQKVLHFQKVHFLQKFKFSCPYACLKYVGA